MPRNGTKVERLAETVLARKAAGETDREITDAFFIAFDSASIAPNTAQNHPKSTVPSAKSAADSHRQAIICDTS